MIVVVLLGILTLILPRVVIIVLRTIQQDTTDRHVLVHFSPLSSAVINHHIDVVHLRREHSLHHRSCGQHPLQVVVDWRLIAQGIGGRHRESVIEVVHDLIVTNAAFRELTVGVGHEVLGRVGWPEVDHLATHLFLKKEGRCRQAQGRKAQFCGDTGIGKIGAPREVNFSGGEHRTRVDNGVVHRGGGV